MSAWLYAVITIGSVIVGVVLNYFLVSWLTKIKMAEQAGENRQKMDELLRCYSALHERMDVAVRDIAYLEGRVNGKTP
jgi:membrane protein YqaA with SNARE-associated domain